MSPSVAAASETSPLLSRKVDQKSSLRHRLRRLRRSDGFSLFVISLCTLCDNLIYGVVLPLLPITLQQYAHVPSESLQRWTWIALASFSVAQIIASALAAYAVIRLSSSRAVMFASLSFLAGAIIIYVFARHPWLVVMARFAQGAANASVNVVGLVILVDRLGPENYGQSFGYIGAATAIGCVTGPVFGGLIYNVLGYEAVFFVAAGIVALCALLVLAIDLTESGSDANDSSSQTLDAARRSNSDLESHQQNGEAPDTKKPAATKTSRLILSILGLSLASLVPCSLETIMPLYTRQLFGWSPLLTGLVFLTFVPGSLLGPYIGSLGDRVGAKTPLVFACLFAAGVMAALSQVTHNSMGDKVLLFIACALSGVAEPAFFSLCGSVVAGVVEETMNKTRNQKSKVVWSSVVVNYAASVGALLAAVVAGNAQDMLGWTGATGIMASIFGLSGVLYLVFM